MASTRPSPANVLLSSTLKLPPSSVSELALFTQSARNGRATPSDSLQSETLSAAISVCRIGTSADWFFRIVTRSFSLYSNRSPTAFPSADGSLSSRASSTSTASAIAAGGGGGARLAWKLPPPLPPPPPPPNLPPTPPITPLSPPP